MKIYFKVKHSGLLELTDRPACYTDGYLHCGEVDSSDKLYDLVTKAYGRGYDYIKRTSGKKEKGSDYTLKKAQNDFEKMNQQ